MSEPQGRWRRALSRLTSSDAQLEAAELYEESVQRGCTPVDEIPARTRATVSGTLRTVTLRPRAGVPALVAELYDGTGTLALVWLGRRRIPGIDPGRSLKATGRVTDEDGVRIIYNPRYELLPSAKA